MVTKKRYLYRGGKTVETCVIIIVIGVALTDAKLWKLMLEQRRHNREVEESLAAIADKLKARS
jgi:hypothetical protein